MGLLTIAVADVHIIASRSDCVVVESMSSTFAPRPPDPSQELRGPYGPRLQCGAVRLRARGVWCGPALRGASQSGAQYGARVRENAAAIAIWSTFRNSHSEAEAEATEAEALRQLRLRVQVNQR